MFKQRHIVITGGSSGLGLALAGRLLDKGARVTLVARQRARLESAQRSLIAARPSAVVEIEALDVTDAAATRSGMDAIAARTEGIDGLINCAGILREGYFETLTDNDFREVMEVNYFGPLNATRAALPHLVAGSNNDTSTGAPTAWLINIASVAGLTGVFGYTPYCASKHALVGLTESLYYELSPRGIRVQLACPGEFDSPMVDQLEQGRTPENRAQTLSIPKASVDAIADDIMAGLAQGDFLIVPTRKARLATLGMRLLPSLSRRLMRRTVERVYQGPDDGLQRQIG
ncbi:MULTISPECIES: SDR family NAD(P)-dependent oxidoreductase [Halomonas]|uniref:SDR family NAD(P)-dependent oxidoreductase n=1 Tax=Halomonas TaxID=2745 RepID=UPI001A8D547E|nr:MULTISPECIES: SDR family NAD(P)-dependent oxidoreductase [Halomonas]MBN8412389.1 SDR family NAD(P)-dependent oxidoreductase [Halomonas litopenaei]MBY5983997.1 SDR family NAD(P)-dependent oxidoreductase [Halomonas sp. DP5Y7-2]MBY6207569.1 SDR family NAD(P)-dependent oxidoreductase [Halomonas sp. DP3Y7-2]MBY6228378.1 SDR family NAD(P)-dependent oxidoreductase [Halomonas sp. DP3Y7-1]MCA0916443.1 SDR family NAD(P)-dependent oxidoreductase [Halomonas denitrificans]